MLIKHYTLDGTLAIIPNVDTVWVYPPEKHLQQDDDCNDYFAYTSECKAETHKVLSFHIEEKPYVLRITGGITAYICNDEGKTLEKVTL